MYLGGAIKIVVTIRAMYNQGLRICNTQTTQLHTENPVNYINLPRAQREIVLRTWRTTLLYPLPKEVVTELIQLALSKHN